MVSGSKCSGKVDLGNEFYFVLEINHKVNFDFIEEERNIQITQSIRGSFCFIAESFSNRSFSQ